MYGSVSLVPPPQREPVGSLDRDVPPSPAMTTTDSVRLSASGRQQIKSLLWRIQIYISDVDIDIDDRDSYRPWLAFQRPIHVLSFVVFVRESIDALDVIVYRILFKI